MMTVQVLFFGATADVVGQRRIEIETAADTIASEVYERMIGEFPAITRHRLHYSVNQQYASGNEVLRDGDEIAIFTAVSGG